jgi:hypothetical protein
VDDETHVIEMAGVADRLVIEFVDPSSIGFTHGGDAARCVESLVGNTVEHDVLAPVERINAGSLPLATRRRATREAVLRCAVCWNNLLVRASPTNGFFRDLAAGCFA